jgi:alpha-ketoglutarate-dependent taurine dioxygenase
MSRDFSYDERALVLQEVPAVPTTVATARPGLLHADRVEDRIDVDGLELEVLGSTLGAVVHGVDLADELDPATGAAVRRALLDHKVLFFRDQHLTPTEQVAFARTLGELTPAHPLAGGLDDDHPEVLVLDSSAYALGLGRRTETTSYNDRWHTDVTFSATPPAASVLCAEILPSRGGDTLWADLEDAYATLSPRLRRVLDETVAFHTAVGAFGYLERNGTTPGRDALAALDAVAHPVVRVHPETGRRSLFVNEAFTIALDGFTERESEVLLDLLFTHSTAAERTVRWSWQPGDVAVWDNRSTAHFAMADYDEHRRMRRVTVAGDRPFGPTG